MTTDAAEQLASTEPLFSEAVVEESRIFAEFLLKNFNELEGVAIVMSWRPPLENLPSVLLRGRDGHLVRPGEITRMQEQLLIGSRYLHDKLNEALLDVDSLMASKAATLKQLEQEIEQRRATISGLSHTGNDGERPATTAADAVTHNEL